MCIPPQTLFRKPPLFPTAAKTIQGIESEEGQANPGAELVGLFAPRR